MIILVVLECSVGVVEYTSWVYLTCWDRGV